MRLAAYLCVDDLKIESDSQAAPLLFDHWMTMILISNAELKLIFKVHFSPGAIGPWAEQKFQVARTSISPRQITDFGKEICNVCAGAIKQEFGLHGVDTGTSLPVLCRGFDELFFDPPDGKRIFVDQWRLAASSGRIGTSIHLDVQDPGLFQRMQIGKTLSLAIASGEVEDL